MSVPAQPRPDPNPPFICHLSIISRAYDDSIANETPAFRWRRRLTLNRDATQYSAKMEKTACLLVSLPCGGLRP
jgi:hypothetical protein